jgi:hypothetical protein
VLGTGAGGLAAAVTGAAEGLSTLVLETTEWLGGTTAYSAGTCWIPDNRFQRADGVTDDHAVASRYLDALVGDRAPRELREAYLTRGPEMIDYFDGLGVRFWPSKKVVDYHPELDGAGLGGRALEPQTFDGRTLGKADFGRVRRPVPEFALFGGTLMVRRAEVNELLTIYKGSPRGVATALKLGVRWAADRLRYPRGTRLAMGNALVANLFARLRARGGRVWFTATATELVREDGRVVGAVVAHQGRELRYARAAAWCSRAAGSPRAPSGVAATCPRPPRSTPGPRRARRARRCGSRRPSVGRWGSPATTTRSGSPAPSAAAATAPPPSSRTSGTGPSRGSSRSDQAGRRFVDESVSYHRFVRAMYAAQAVPAWLVIDAAALRRYGLGMVRPHTPVRKYVEAGYLHRGATVRELAASIGVDPDGLAATVAAANRAAESGVDEEFGKGRSVFGHQYGDPQHRPNVNLGPIATAPFYAIPVVPTPLGTALGLRTDESARVLDAAGEPITGLYACGNDAQSVMGSEYPGAGCQVGAGLTFGYVAARHAAVSAPVVAEVAR